MRWNLLSLFARNDDETRTDVRVREQEVRDARALNRLRRAEARDMLFAAMLEDPVIDRDDHAK